MSNPQAPPIEPPRELARLRQELFAFYRPANSQERLAVERLALAHQSILRAARLETSLFQSVPGGELQILLEGAALHTLMRYQAQAERLYRRAVEEFLIVRSQRPLLVPTVVPAPKPRCAPTPIAAANPSLRL